MAAVGYLKKYLCLNPLCWKFIYELQTMNCTEHMTEKHMIVTHMVEIHTMKFNYEIPYKENYKQNVHQWSDKHYTGIFLSKENSYTSDSPNRLAKFPTNFWEFLQKVSHLTFPKFVPNETKKKFSEKSLRSFDKPTDKQTVWYGISFLILTTFIQYFYNSTLINTYKLVSWKWIFS